MEASSLILITSNNRIILQLRDDSEGVYYRGFWGLIGGAANKGESPCECMVRECIEEVGWRPNYLRKVMEMHEHCKETVFVSYIESEQLLHCFEGQQIKAFVFKEIEDIKISDYHKRIIKLYINDNTSLKCLSNVKVLFYTKVLPPAFGGYVSAGMNLFRVFSTMMDVSMVTDNEIQTIVNNDEVYDLLFFNATYERSLVFGLLSKKCKQAWTFEHNELTDEHSVEMTKRFNKASRIIVPSTFLKNKITKCIGNNGFKELSVLPIPINSAFFSFRPHPIKSHVFFITCCAIKPVRNLEFVMNIMKDLTNYGLSFQWDIYGDVPFQGDYHYLEYLQSLINQLGIADVVKFHKALTRQNELVEVLHESDFYIDFAEKETYGMAKIEAALSGTRMILPPIDNNMIFEKNLEFFSGSHEQVAEMIYNSINRCMKEKDKDMEERLKVRDLAMQFNDLNVSKLIKTMIYEAV